jgi:hypothetical protein
LQCAMALAMPSCFSRSVSSRRAGGGEDWPAADAERLFRSRLEIMVRYRRNTSPECGLLASTSRSPRSGEPYQSLAERALVELREKLARPP